MANQVLNEIRQILEEAGNFIVKNEKATFPYLDVILPVDEKGRERFLAISAEGCGATNSSTKEEAIFVQMFHSFPFKIPKKNEKEVLKLLNFFNKTLPMPGLFWGEELDKVFYRYSFLQSQEHVDGKQLLSIIGLILVWIDSLSNAIEETAHGKPMSAVILEAQSGNQGSKGTSHNKRS